MSSNSLDVLEVINGPEDGIQHPLVKPMLSLGKKESCEIQFKLDERVELLHARLFASGGGYKVRRLGSLPVKVNGKSAGMVFSRLLGNGDRLQIGRTRLLLICSPEGFAARNAGIKGDSDIVWALRASGIGTFNVFKGTWRHLHNFLGRKIWIILPVIFLLITGVLSPNTLKWLWYYILVFKSHVLAQFQ